MRAPLPGPDSFGWNLFLGQLVHGYHWLAFLNHLFQLRICRPPPPLPFRSGPIFMKDAHSAEPHEKYIFRFFQFFIFWVISDCIYNLRLTRLNFQVCHQPKKSFKCGQIYRKYAQWTWTNEKLIVGFLFFVLWSICTNFEYKNDHIKK